MRIAEIRYNVAAYIWEEETEVLPIFPPYTDGTKPLLVDITDKEEVQENWIYNTETGEFIKPVSLEDTALMPCL